MEKGVLIILAFFTVIPPILRAGPVDLADPDPAWAPVLETLQEPETILSRFEESRSNPFHRLTREFSGVIRWVPSRGLSIHYREPKNVIIQVTPHAVFVSHEGKQPQKESMAGEGGVLPMIQRLFAWDTAWLSSNFETTGEMDPDGNWELTFSPLEDQLAGMINRMVLTGKDGLLREITLHVRGGRKIEIRLVETTLNPAFSEEELKEAFPTLDE